MNRDARYLNHILGCIARIDAYTEASGRGFAEDDLVFDAVLRNLQVLAESTQRLSPECKATRPDIAWRSISGFRNIIVHNYLGPDPMQIEAIV